MSSQKDRVSLLIPKFPPNTQKNKKNRATHIFPPSPLHRRRFSSHRRRRRRLHLNQPSSPSASPPAVAAAAAACALLLRPRLFFFSGHGSSSSPATSLFFSGHVSTQMTDIARGHNGDCRRGGPPGGGPPDGNWEPGSGCQASGGGKRKKTRNKALKAAIGKVREGVLPIDFETENAEYVAVGPNGDGFTSLVGTIVSKIPSHFATWKQIPPEYTTTIIPEIESYFDLNPYFLGADYQMVEEGIFQYCKRRYRGQKNKLKAEWFDARGGISCAGELRTKPPPDVDEENWNSFVDLVTSDAFIKRSNANKECRAKNTAKVYQGSKSMAQNRFENRDPVTLQPPSLIDEYKRLRTKKGVITSQSARENHARMMAMKDDQVGKENPKTDKEIYHEVIGTRRGWQVGVGPRMPKSVGFSNSASSSGSQPGKRVCTQDDFIAKMRKEWRKDMKTMASTGSFPDDDACTGSLPDNDACTASLSDDDAEDNDDGGGNESE